MARFERGKGPLVLCFSDGQAPPSASGRATLDALSAEAAFFAVGTGSDRLDVAAATQALSDRPLPLDGTTLDRFLDHMHYNSGTVTDPFTEKETPKCRLHLFVEVEKDGAAVRALEALLDVLIPHNFPLGIHMILSGPEKTAFTSVDAVLDRIHDKVPILTMAGAEHAVGADVDWDKVLDTYRAVVMLFEGDTYPSLDHALRDHYGAELHDVAIPPLRIGEFEGLPGDLRLEFPAPPGAPPGPPWEWRSDDLGMIITSRGDHLERLLRVLTRSGLPEDVAKMVTVRGRPVRAFDTSSLMSLVPMRGVALRSLLDTRASQSLVEVCASRGKRCARVVDAAHAALATFSFDGDRDLALGAQVEPSASEAIAAAARALDDGDVLVVAAGEADLEPLRAAVAAKGGALAVVAGGTLSVYGEGLTLEAAGSHRDVYATVLDLAAIDNPTTGAHSLVKQ